MIISSAPNLSGPYIHMALLSPLFDLEAHKMKYSRQGLDEKDLDCVSFLHLALEVFEYVIQSTPNEGALYAEVKEHLCGRISAMTNSLSTAKMDAISEIVIQKLNNDSGKVFQTVHFNPETQSLVPFQFRYMLFEPDSMNENRFKLAPEGYAIYYTLNHTVPINDPGLESAVLEVLLEKGTADHVLQSTRAMKGLVYELYQHIQNNITRAYRTPDKVTWSVDIEPLLVKARKAIIQQQQQERVHILRVQARLELSEEEQINSAKQWRRVLDLMEDTAGLRLDLLTYMNSTYQEYEKAKLRCLTIKRKSLLANLENELLPQLLHTDVATLDTLIDEWLPLFFPPQRCISLDFSTIESIAMTASPVNDHAPLCRVAPVLVSNPDVLLYPPTLRQDVNVWLEHYAEQHNVFNFSECMLDYCQTVRTYDEQYLLAWTVFTKFNSSLLMGNNHWRVSKKSTIWEHDFLCADELYFEKLSEKEDAL